MPSSMNLIGNDFGIWLPWKCWGKMKIIIIAMRLAENELIERKQEGLWDFKQIYTWKKNIN